MGNIFDTVSIPRSEYDELLECRAKLEIVENIIVKDDSSYGYSSNTRATLEAVLGISREKKEKAD